MSKDRDFIIKRYGEEAFYKALEAFYEKHRVAGASIEVDTELNMPIKAVYVFEPVLVAYEDVKLKEALRQGDWERTDDEDGS